MMKTRIAMPLQQHPHFAAALTRLGRPVRFVDIDGAAPVLAVRQCGQLITSRGPVWQRVGQDDAMRGSELRLINADKPDDTLLRAAGFYRLMTNAHVAELDLSRSEGARQAAMTPKWRNAWRVARSSPMTLAETPYEKQRHAWLLKADLAQQRSKRFRGLPHALIDAYARDQPDKVQVIVGYERETPIAAMLFLLHWPVATYHIGWTGPRGRELCAHHRMIIDAADRFSQRGFSRMDLGLVDTENTPGLARFKIGTGAQVRPLGGTWARLPFLRHQMPDHALRV
ncbi:GNAT family N-acetyltransferase [Yoonia sp.]|uniref:GNAT family N-acetyltransferase n=1 Tax=Yoonia sp. TaxID=2212373 RepID=UPI0039767AD2